MLWAEKNVQLTDNKSKVKMKLVTKSLSIFRLFFPYDFALLLIYKLTF